MVDDTPLIAQTSSNKKQGHRVLCCCDSRKGAIFVGLASVILMIITLIGYTASSSGPTDAWTIANLSISILFYLLVIWGAIRYHTCAVLVSLIWEVVALVLIIIGTATYDWDSVSGQQKEEDIAAVAILMAWRVLVIYVNSTFLREVNSGVMSERTHSREKYSCCCNV